jgi:hypothetical protein
VEVNGKEGILITVRTGSGQGDPLTSILFLIGSEQLNKLVATKFPEIMYVTMVRVLESDPSYLQMTTIHQ